MSETLPDRSESAVVLIVDDVPDNLSVLHDALDELVSLGYYRGIVRKLDEIEASDARHAAFANQLRALAQQFQLDAMTRIIRQALDDSPAAPSFADGSAP